MNENVDSHFIKMIESGLSYWIQDSESPTEPQIKQYHLEQKNLTKLIKFGLGHKTTMALACRLLLQLFTFVERYGLYQEWMGFYESAIVRFPEHTPLNTQLRLKSRLSQLYHLANKQPLAEATLFSALKEAKVLNDKEILGQIYCGLCVTFKTKEDYLEAEKYGRLALNLAKKTSELVNIQALANQLLGMIYRHQGEIDKAIQAYKISMRFWSEIDKPLSLTRTTADLARAFITKQQYDNAEKFFQKALIHLSSTHSELDKSVIHINKGHLYFRKKEWEKAESEFLLANSEFLQKSSHLTYKAAVFNNLGAVMFEQNRFQAAEENYNKSIQIRRILNSKLPLVSSLLNLIELFLHISRDDDAIKYFNELRQIIGSEEAGFLNNKFEQRYSKVSSAIRK